MIGQFRGKKTNSDEWVYGYLLRDEKERPFIVGYVVESSEEYIGLDWWQPVLPSSVGRATRLKDKGNVDVYENDIFDFGAGWVSVVKWHNESCGFGLYCPEHTEWDDYQLYKKSLEGSTRYITKKVIGNLTDNPDLVKAV